MISYAKQIKSRGFTTLPEIKYPSKELISIASSIEEFLKEPVKIKSMSKKAVLTESQNFLLHHFRLYDIPYEKRVKFLTFNFEISKYIHPFALPIKYVSNNDSFYGCSREVLSFTTGSEVCSSLKYRWIELPNDLTELTPLAYTHEIIHTQLNHVPGIIKEYNNIEFLSVFLEIVEAFESSNFNLMHIHDFYRLCELKEIINDLEKNYDSCNSKVRDILLEGTSYLHSTLKAYHLFDIYLKGNNELRKTIMIGIQRVLSHIMSIEELLAYFDITYENSINEEIFQKHIRGI